MSTQDRFNRREVMKTSVLALGSGLLMSDARQAYSKAVNTNSSPSTLKVADLRVAKIVPLWCGFEVAGAGREVLADHVFIQRNP